MATKLEDYLHKQRDSLDVESPDDQLIWEGIRQKLQASRIRMPKNRTLIRLRNIAAALILVVSVGYMLQDLVGERRWVRGITLADIDHNRLHLNEMG